MIKGNNKYYDGDVIICPVCKKKFVKNSMSVYKQQKKTGVIYYCGYTCYREGGGGK